MIKFGEWLPDIAPLESPGLEEAINVLPAIDGYRPFRAIDPYTATVSSTATVSWVLGAVSVFNDSGESEVYVGNGASLFELSGDDWLNRTRTATSSVSVTNIAVPYNTSPTRYWEFAKWQNIVLATNDVDYPQYKTTGESTVFKNLTDYLRFRVMGVVRDFVVAGNVVDEGSAIRYPSRIHWSAINGIVGSTNWTPSSVTLCDFQDLKAESGAVQKVVGGEYGTVICENSIYRLTYIGVPAIFQVDEIHNGVGTQYPRSVVNIGDSIFLLSNQGFIELIAGIQINNIGANKVDSTVINAISQGYKQNVIAAVDYSEQHIYWIYPDDTAINGRPNNIVVYDRKSGKWSSAREDLWLVFNAMSIGTSLDELTAGSSYPDLDAMTLSLDSNVFKGGTRFMGAFDDEKRLGAFTGTALSAQITTGEARPGGDRRSRVTSVRPNVDGGTTVSVQIGHRNRQQDTVTYSSEVATNARGECPVRVNSQYMNLRVKTTGNFAKIMGADYKLVGAGKR